MKNPITEIFESLTDDELREALNQIREDEPLGIIRIDGHVRDISNKVSEITGESFGVHQVMVLMGIFREAAYRFY